MRQRRIIHEGGKATDETLGRLTDNRTSCCWSLGVTGSPLIGKRKDHLALDLDVENGDVKGLAVSPGEASP
jgi:hypothetical protein